MNLKLWEKFLKYGSGFDLEAEREYDKPSQPYFYHLRCYGLAFPTDYELLGFNLDKLLKKAIEDGQKEMSTVNPIYKKQLKSAKK